MTTLYDHQCTLLDVGYFVSMTFMLLPLSNENEMSIFLLRGSQYQRLIKYDK